MSEPNEKLDKQLSQIILAHSAKLAEEELTDRVRSGKARWPNTAFNLLTALAIYSIDAVNGECVLKTNTDEIIQMANFIVTSPEYTPGSHLPFTKDQMLHAYKEATKE